MKFHTKLALIASYAVASFVTLVVADAAAVEVDINQKIGPQVTTLNNDVNGYPASGLTGALAIHSDVQTLVATINNATNDVKSSGSFSEADGTTILADIQTLLSTFSDTLAAFGAQAPVWADIPGGQALVLSDLRSLNTSTIGFTNAFLAAAPADLVPAVKSVETELSGALNSAIAAYSS